MFAGGGADVNVSLSNITGIEAGDLVTLTAYAIGDQPVQTNTIDFIVNGGTPIIGTFTTSFVNDNFATSDQITFTATAPITSLNFIGNSTGTFGNLNGFSVTAIPEPSSLALLGLGSLATFVRRRRR